MRFAEGQNAEIRFDDETREDEAFIAPRANAEPYGARIWSKLLCASARFSHICPTFFECMSEQVAVASVSRIAGLTKRLRILRGGCAEAFHIIDGRPTPSDKKVEYEHLV